MGLGGGVAVLEPAGLGLLLGGEGVSLSLALSLQGGAGDDDSERERSRRICSRGQAGVARDQEGSGAGCARHNLTDVTAALR